MSVNKVILIGNVGKDPEIRYLESGVAVARLPLATSEVYKNKEGEKISNTDWHNIVLWRGLAEIAEKYIKKGSQLYIEGRIKTRSYTDRDGNVKYTTEIIGDNMQMLGKRSDDSSYAPSSSSEKSQAESNYEQSEASSSSQSTSTPQQNKPESGISAASTNADNSDYPTHEEKDTMDEGGEPDDLPF